jgi:hypothetical protein
MKNKKVPAYVKCNCGHTAKQHYQGTGQCNECGCTWFWPNDKWVLKNNLKKVKSEPVLYITKK